MIYCCGPLVDYFWWCLSWVSKPEWIPHLHALSPACNWFLRFTSGATSAGLLATNPPAEPFWSTYLSLQTWWNLSPRSGVDQPSGFQFKTFRLKKVNIELREMLIIIRTKNGFFDKKSKFKQHLPELRINKQDNSYLVAHRSFLTARMWIVYFTFLNKISEYLGFLGSWMKLSQSTWKLAINHQWNFFVQFHFFSFFEALIKNFSFFLLMW